MAKQQEARRERRHPLNICAWLRFKSDEASHGAVTLDLSAEGARFGTVNPLDCGEPVMVHLQLTPNAYPIECKGRVCWSERMQDGLYNFGLRFLDLRDDEREELRGFLGTGGASLYSLA
jgi:hypothetical protein